MKHTGAQVGLFSADPTGTHSGMGLRKDRARFEYGSVPLLLPAVILLLVLFIGPVLYSLYLGLTNIELLGPNSIRYHFTGTRNVHRMMSDPEFYKSIWLTFVFVFGSGAVGATLLGLVLAMLMQASHHWMQRIVGSVVILACVLPQITAALIWRSATTAGGAFSSVILGSTGELLYTSPMAVVCVANMWSMAGLAMLMFSAALKNIPGDLAEAAKLENAGPVAQFLRITAPLLKPTFASVALLMTILSLGNFSLIFLMTGGGPNGQTSILPVYSYIQGFAYHKLGYGALLGNVIIILSLVLGVAATWPRKGRAVKQ
jgi:multiple sugar transport system permease protein